MHPICSGEEELDRIPNTFKEAIVLPQAARWKVVSDKVIASLERRGDVELIPITSVPAGHKVVGTRWMFKIKVDTTSMVDSLCTDFRRSPAWTAAVPSLPCVCSRIFA